MNTILAILPAAISAILGFGIAHIVCKRITTNSKLQKFLSYVIFISIGIGLTGIGNEFLVAVFLGGSVKIDKVIMFVFSNIIVIPVLLYAVIFLSNKFSNRTEFVANEVSTVEANSSINQLKTSLNLNGTSMIFIGGFVVLIVAFFIFNSGSFNRSDKSFEFKECISCTNDDCRQNLNLKGFKVTLNQLFVFLKTKEGQDRIVSYPEDSNMKCAILPDRNFAFDCNSFKNDSGFVTSNVITFDGNEKYVSNFTQKLLGGNPRGIEMITRCTVN